MFTPAPLRAAQRKPRTADRVHGTQVRERRSSDRHRWAKPSETAYRCLRRIAGTAWNADLRSAPPAAGGRNRASPSCADGAREQNVGIGGDLHSSPAHPAAAASFSSSTERRRVPGSANMPKTLEIGSPGFARSRTWPSGSRSTSTLSPCRAPRCSRTSLRRVIWPSAVTVSVMAMARSPYGRKALWPFPKIQIPLLGGTTGGRHPDEIGNAGVHTRHRCAAAQRNPNPPPRPESRERCPSARTRLCFRSPAPINRRGYRPQLGPVDPGYRPELRRPTPAIDRSCTNRPRLSTGVPPTDPFIDRSSASRPRLSTGAPASGPRLSTGAPPTDPVYRPELCQPTPFIDRSSASRPRLSTGAAPTVKRHQLLRTWETPTFTH